jgi:hypothetical protein
MVLAKRISIVKTLTLIQLVLTCVLGAIFFAFSFTVGIAAMSEGGVGASLIVLIGIGLGVLLIFLASLALPWVVLEALRRRKEQWATAAFISMLVQIVIGGGLLSIFPIISLVLLVNKEASAYIGMK